MPTVMTHAVMGAAACRLCPSEARRFHVLWATSIVMPVLPDLDMLLWPVFGYDHPFGHRGFSHSLSFAVLAGLVAAGLCWRVMGQFPGRFAGLWLYFALLVASHGFFDGMTNGGRGIGFFVPFENGRYFWPWRPIPVAPLSAAGLFTAWGMRVLGAELLMFWTVAAAVFLWTSKRTMPRLALGASLALLGLGVWVWRFSIL